MNVKLVLRSSGDIWGGWCDAYLKTPKLWNIAIMIWRLITTATDKASKHLGQPEKRNWWTKAACICCGLLFYVFHVIAVDTEGQHRFTDCLNTSI